MIALATNRDVDRLFAENQGLVHHCVIHTKMRFGGRIDHTILDGDDLVIIGQMALHDAARGFDPERGIKFSTYACRAIFCRLSRELRAPKNRTQNVSFVADEYYGDITDYFERGSTVDREWYDSEDIRSALRRLEEDDYRRWFVIHLRYLAERTMTFKEIGRAIGRSAQRVKQLEASAVEKLRGYMEGVPQKQAAGRAVCTCATDLTHQDSGVTDMMTTMIPAGAEECP